MTASKDPRQGRREWLALVLFLLGVVLLFSAQGCSPRIVERTIVRRDTLYQVRVDSVLEFRRDSVYLREKGDTIYKYVEKVRLRDRWHYDTIRVVKVDSVAVESIKEVQVEKPLSWWKRARMAAFWPLLVQALGLGVWTFRKPLLKLLSL